MAISRWKEIKHGLFVILLSIVLKELLNVPLTDLKLQSNCKMVAVRGTFPEFDPNSSSNDSTPFQNILWTKDKIVNVLLESFCKNKNKPIERVIRTELDGFQELQYC